MKMELQEIKYMPKVLESGILYVSVEYGIAAHLCACGCGSKIRTPLGPTEWTVKKSADGPTLYPSIGNWQLPCQSHYWIQNGEISWSSQWSPEQVKNGRKWEEARREEYYRKLDRGKVGIIEKVKRLIKSFRR